MNCAAGQVQTRSLALGTLVLLLGATSPLGAGTPATNALSTPQASPAAEDRLPVLQTVVRPDDLRMDGCVGEVLVGFIVDSKGAVRDVRVVRSSHRELEAAAVAVVNQWKFTPGLKGGRAVNTRMKVVLPFGRANAPTPAPEPDCGLR